jgi:hypothetical protein
VTLGPSRRKSRIRPGIFAKLAAFELKFYRGPQSPLRFLNFPMKRDTPGGENVGAQPLNRKDLNGYLFMPSMANSSARRANSPTR